MQVKKIQFSRGATTFYFDASFAHLKKIVSQETTVLITDSHIAAAYPKLLKGWNTIILNAGEAYKVQATVDDVIRQLIAMHADRTWTLVGMGGGVVTDITGYVASIYLRGVSFGFVPTTLLAMVDAAIGGKNGIDVGLYKNMIGTINQPQFLLYDVALLKSLPVNEWRNGFAEIIKHAAILDAVMYKELEKKKLLFYQKNKPALQKLVQRNALLKAKVVKEDEFEKDKRRLLNFGHTLGHAVEKQYELMHGEAVAIGMVFASKLSAELLQFKGADKLIQIIDQYGLPITAGYNKQKVFDVLVSDKKREGEQMNFVLLEKIGKATVKKIPLQELFKHM
ncbi:MAG TPA: 3-dehydroquinate synthase [Flavisolibacter sp.]|jgi:3-dehydroquinate synthase|nr:3-dehydroquinate synthase [Flavisolibacter sp.]